LTEPSLDLASPVRSVAVGKDMPDILRRLGAGRATGMKPVTHIVTANGRDVPPVAWQDEALSVATHKPQVYIDLSDWSPEYFAPQVVLYANSLLKNKVLFGSEFPVITPARWMKDFEGIAITDEVRPKILEENAAKLFGLVGSEAGA
jgi:hypothetical protein